jgi:hypothetical protein
MAIRDDLRREGYCVVRSLLTPARVAELRDTCRSVGARMGKCGDGESTIRPSEFLAVPELATIPFDPGVVGALRGILGEDYVTIPEYSMMTNAFGAWHYDSGSQGHADYLYAPDFFQVECAIYLQDNDPRYGGGLDLKPRTHREFWRFGSPASLLRRGVRRMVNTYVRRPKTIETKAGDMVVWHFNLWHRATPRIAANAALDGNKYGIFWGASNASQHVQRYMEHVRLRPKDFYRDIASLKYPDSYHMLARALVDRQNLRIAA